MLNELYYNIYLDTAKMTGYGAESLYSAMINGEDTDTMYFNLVKEDIASLTDSDDILANDVDLNNPYYILGVAQAYKSFILRLETLAE